MRLKDMDGHLSVRNGNAVILNSPKRLNTVQNSITSTYGRTDNDFLNNIDGRTVSDSAALHTTWYGGEVALKNNANNGRTNNANHKAALNIYNTLAESLATNTRPGTASSICSESSPDDSLLDYEDAHESCSSADASPQDEDCDFCISDSESDVGNLNHHRGIINPNYPGFQHLAHTLQYSYKETSDAEEDEYGTGAAANCLNNNNNNEEPVAIDSVNRLDSVENIQKVFHDKPIFNIACEDDAQIQASVVQDNIPLNIEDPETDRNSLSIVGNLEEEIEREFDFFFDNHLHRAVEKELEEAVEKLTVCQDFSPTASKYKIEPNVGQSFNKAIETETQVEEMAAVMTYLNSDCGGLKTKLTDAFLSSVKDTISEVHLNMFTKDEADCSLKLVDSNRDEAMEVEKSDDKIDMRSDCEKFCKEDLTKDDQEKDEDSAVPRKKEKMESGYVKKRRDYNQQMGSLITIPRRDNSGRTRDPLNRRSVPLLREKKRSSTEVLGEFDVYNIETAMPKIDMEAIESHLRAAREEERRRRTDREEIRRRLAMGNEDEYYGTCDRPGRKPSLQARLQSGMNLQICFMNETTSDTESPSSDSESTFSRSKLVKANGGNADGSSADAASKTAPTRPATLPIGQQEPLLNTSPLTTETDFFARQARLQTEARMALAQAKEMARMQMEIERQRQKKSPITEMVRHSLEKVGIPFPEDRRRLSRQILTEMNVAQLQVIVNDLHTQIEILNENLVKFLMDRDDLHMEQDSMLVDIEDLTRFLGAKEQMIKDGSISSHPPSPAPPSPLASLNSSVKPHFNRIASFVKK